MEAGTLAFAQDVVDRRDLGAIDAGTEHVLAQLSWGAFPRRHPEAVADVRPERLREERVVLGVAPFFRKAERGDAVQLGEGALRGREQDFVRLGVRRPATGGDLCLSDEALKNLEDDTTYCTLYR